MHQGKFLLLTQSVNREAGSSVSLLTIMVAVLHVAPDVEGTRWGWNLFCF